MSAGKPRNNDQYSEVLADNIKVYVAASVKADRVIITHKPGFFGGLRVALS